jgi:hypothetical protein
MDWLAKMIGLPNDFLHSHADTTGGGVIQVREKKNIHFFVSIINF